MAISQQQEQNTPFSLLDALYCEEEEQWEEEEDEVDNGEKIQSLLPLMLSEQDLFWEDEELLTLFSKERQEILELSLSTSSFRREKVEWMLKVNSHFGFCTLTSILSVNYFDRFLSSFTLQEDKPWMFQLAAVTCISLAAKVEETHVPLLLDLQIEGTKYVFEAKTIQKMELLVLSTLDWKMNPVTPISFLDHIIRRLGLKNNLHWEFLRQCERLLLSVLSEGRFVGYLPSLLAASTMMYAIDQIELCNPLQYKNQLLDVLNISKERVNDCYKLIEELSCSEISINYKSSKRKFEQMMNNNNNTNDGNIISSSPSGIIDASYNYLSSADSSNDSWLATSTTSPTRIVYGSSSSLTSSSSVTSSPTSINGRKKGRLQLPSFSSVFVDIVGSPR